MSVLIWLVTFLILVSSAASELCDHSCVQKPRATFYENSSYAFSQGACGYGTYGTRFNVNDYFAGATSSIYKNGIGCGRCYQVKCTNEEICNKGVNVTLTDEIKKGHGAFVLSETAFKAMAKNQSSDALFKQGHVAIQYKRVPCNYGDRKIIIWVEASSNKKNYLAIKFLYKGGQSDIEEVKVATIKANTTIIWESMSRSYGAIWSTKNVRSGRLSFKLVVPGHGNVYTKALPANWKEGNGYDSNVQLFTSLQSCNVCK